MSKFTDKAGREWVLELHMAHSKRVREATGVKLLDLENGGAFAALCDPETCVDVLWAILQKEAKARGLGPEDFAAGLTGDFYIAASNALFDAICDFHPSKVAAVLRNVVAAIKEGKDPADVLPADDDEAPPPTE